jgi:arylformamidase
VYPGNPKVEYTLHTGATSVHTTITFGSHTGTHIDAPKHTEMHGKGIMDLPLDVFYGPVRVFDVSFAVGSVQISHLEPYAIQKGERIFLKTSNSIRGLDVFYDDYVFLDGDCADYLANKEIALCGIDYFSIKQRGGSDQRPHTSLLSYNIPIIEGINLKDIAEGEYIVSAFPLALHNLDGAPARIVLIAEHDEVISRIKK